MSHAPSLFTGAIGAYLKQGKAPQTPAPAPPVSAGELLASGGRPRDAVGRFATAPSAETHGLFTGHVRAYLASAPHEVSIDLTRLRTSSDPAAELVAQVAAAGLEPRLLDEGALASVRAELERVRSARQLFPSLAQAQSPTSTSELHALARLGQHLLAQSGTAPAPAAASPPPATPAAPPPAPAAPAPGSGIAVGDAA